MNYGVKDRGVGGRGTFVWGRSVHCAKASCNSADLHRAITNRAAYHVVHSAARGYKPRSNNNSCHTDSQQ